jgi:hypothetical protein
MTRRLITALVIRALYLAVSIPADGSISARRGFAIDRRRVCQWATDVVAADAKRRDRQPAYGLAGLPPRRRTHGSRDETYRPGQRSSRDLKTAPLANHHNFASTSHLSVKNLQPLLGPHARERIWI